MRRTSEGTSLGILRTDAPFGFGAAGCSRCAAAMTGSRIAAASTVGIRRQDGCRITEWPRPNMVTSRNFYRTNDLILAVGHPAGAVPRTAWQNHSTAQASKFAGCDSADRML